jgi:hypothetical protein
MTGDDPALIRQHSEALAQAAMRIGEAMRRAAGRMPVPRPMIAWSTPNSKTSTTPSAVPPEPGPPLHFGEIAMTMDNLVGPAGGQSAGNDAMSALLAQDWWAIALRACSRS